MGHQQPYHQWEERPGELGFTTSVAGNWSLFYIIYCNVECVLLFLVTLPQASMQVLIVFHNFIVNVPFTFDTFFK